METSYSVINAFVWAIPVLGFIGTVLGLSQAIGQFGGVLQGALRNPSEAPKQFGNLIFGFAVTEALGIFSLLIALLLMFAV